MQVLSGGVSDRKASTAESRARGHTGATGGFQVGSGGAGIWLHPGCMWRTGGGLGWTLGGWRRLCRTPGARRWGLRGGLQ